MGLNRPVHVSLDAESHFVLVNEANENGVSLSAWLRAIARFLNVEISFSTPISELRQKFRIVLSEELGRR